MELTIQTAGCMHFYGLNKVEVKIADATTTLSGGKLGETLLSSKTEKIVLTQTDKDGNKLLLLL